MTRRLRKQRGGAAILGTESIAQWLEKVSASFDATKSRLAETTPPPVYDFALFEDIPDFDSGLAYIMPLELKSDATGVWKAVMPADVFGPAQAEKYALNGNYGRVIKANVMDLTKSGRSDEFRATVMNTTEELAQEKIMSLLQVEEILRKILREHIGGDVPAAEPVNNLSDEKKYPLFIWAVALKAGEGELAPMLTPPEEPAPPAK